VNIPGFRPRLFTANEHGQTPIHRRQRPWRVGSQFAFLPQSSDLLTVSSPAVHRMVTMFDLAALILAVGGLVGAFVALAAWVR
jgi:hypothetical protein